LAELACEKQPELEESMSMRMLVGMAILTLSFNSLWQDSNADDWKVADQILNQFWHREGENAIEARAAYEGLNNPSVETRLAYVFQRMNHFRYREALPVARELVRSHPDHSEALAALSWLETLLGSNNEALITMRDLRQSLGGQPPADQQRQFYLRHLGRMIGFLEGPGNRQVNRETLDQTVAQILNGLAPDNVQIFEDARQDVTDQFDQLKQDQETARNNFLNEAQKKAAAETAAIQTSNQALKQQRDQIPTRMQTVTDSFNQRSASLRNQIQPIESEYRMLETQLFPLHLQWQNTITQMALWDRRFTRPDEPPSYWDQVLRNQFAFEASRIDAQILFIRQQMRGLEFRVASLNQELYLTNQQFQQQLDSFRIEDQQITRQMERNSNRIQKLMSGPSRITGDAMSIAQRIDKLKTYGDFPIEQFRGKLLKQIRGKK
jgi:hypothetical protein